MQINLSKLETGDKVAFSERVEKTVCHTCGDNGETRSVSFTDGTILNRDDSLWELAELTEPEVIWEQGEYGGQTGYESKQHKALGDCRFSLEESVRGFTLMEYIDFPNEETAKIYANKSLKLWRSRANGN
jgi:hypothetical protein